MQAPQLTYMARGGGCFLAGTRISTPSGLIEVETLRAGDQVYSFNEIAQAREISTIGSIDVHERLTYYLINNAVRATGEHPFYTTKGIKVVEDLEVGDVLINEADQEEEIFDIVGYQAPEPFKVYNLLDVSPNNNYFAEGYLVHNKGGGCFLAGTQVRTPNGTKNIEKLRPRDTVVTYDEVNDRQNYSLVQTVQIHKVDGYYILNGVVKASATHPFYTMTDDGVLNKKQTMVKNLKIGDNLVTDAGWQKLSAIQYIEGEVTVYNLINVEPNHNFYAGDKRIQYLVHNKGGGGRGGGGGGRSSSSHSSSSKSSSKSSSTASKPLPPPKPKLGTSTAKPGSKIKTADGKEVQSSAKAPSNKKYTTSKGVIGDNGYHPRFTNGYSPPAGSVVYYPQHNFTDYLLLSYLFNHDSPRNDQVTTVQPDGKEVVAQPVREGTDGLAVFNWIFLFVIVIAIVVGIVWGVNKLTSKPAPKKAPSYGW